MKKLAIAVRQKIDLLREQELYAYQIAYYILQNQRLAEEAAKTALIELSRGCLLLKEPTEELRTSVKRLTVHASLALAGAASAPGKAKEKKTVSY
ncbi:hypothetical protein [Paenibacillus harenae]|uniref:Uncharacterized protein n=1 Tax=Paenibacillus harenae TaxID=306543 RepID=A0ABT9U8K0_PAEHA|nr:hypothetical protein [Paenibacillus harenae]MDQ0063700.1 hypothetical protein [Paenibacillus harenae]MDQ0115980.1 hypothetical protein [Paenibacillus harenae]